MSFIRTADGFIPGTAIARVKGPLLNRKNNGVDQQASRSIRSQLD